MPITGVVVLLCAGLAQLPAPAEPAPAASAPTASLPLAAQRAAHGPQAPTAPAVWERVVVIGASASAGFGTAAELGSDVPLAAALEPMLRLSHAPVQDRANSLFFLDPAGHGANQVADALAQEPTLVVALDFLFWFGYGVKDDDERREDLDHGLRLLERFSCPVLVGLIPDMRPAVGEMLVAEQVPPPEALARLNARIAEWASGRANAVLVPVPGLVDAARSGGPVRAGLSEWPRDGARILIQPDRLHPTVEGLAALAALALEQLARARRDVPEEAFVLDPIGAAQKVRWSRLGGAAGRGGRGATPDAVAEAAAEQMD